VLARGQELRIEAGIRCDQGRRFVAVTGFGSGATTEQIATAEAARDREYAAAKPLFDSGSTLIDRAAREGARLPDGGMPRDFPTSEARERTHWRRPITIEEMAAA
jgi:hypothetical protein